MIYLLHGKDDYRVRESLRRIRHELSAGDPRFDDTSASTLEGRSVTPGELLANAAAAPFLAANRLVMVEGLVEALMASAGRKKKDVEETLAPWRETALRLGDPANMPATTTLVFVERDVATTSPALAVFAPVAQVIDHPPMSKEEMVPWVAQRATEKDVKLAPRSVAALVQLIGPDLWTLDTELDKLGAYAAGEVVEPETVSRLVSAAREVKVWDLTDAIVAANERRALQALQALLADGEPAPMLAFMVVRQFRQLATVKDLRERGVRQDEVARASGVPHFRLSAVGALASRYSWRQLRSAYARMLEADLHVKRGLQDDETALYLLVRDLAAAAPGGAAPRERPAMGRQAGRPSA